MMRAALTLLCALLSLDAMACDGLKLDHVWLRQPPPASEVAAAYFEARNNGQQALIIKSVSSADFKSAMLHTTRVVDGRAEMRAQGDIVLAPGARFSAVPGGAHVMLFGAQQLLQEGISLTLEVRCAQGKPLRVALPVLRDTPP